VKVKVYDVCASSTLLTALYLWKVDMIRSQQPHALGIYLLNPHVVLVAENVAGDRICLMLGDDFQAYVERPLRLSTGLSSVGSCGTSPCNLRRHLRGGEGEAVGLRVRVWLVASCANLRHEGPAYLLLSAFSVSLSFSKSASADHFSFQYQP
jgi:hypothetical protein